MASAGMGSLLIELVERKRKLDEAKALEEALTAAAAAVGGGGSGPTEESTKNQWTGPSGLVTLGGESENDEKVAMEVLNTLLVDHQGTPGTPSGAVDENAMIAGVAGAARAEQLLYGK